MRKLRLVKVIVHPIFVVDDGESLTEFPNSPSEIQAADWPKFPARLVRDIAAAEAQINSPQGDNRAQRRAGAKAPKRPSAKR